MPSSASLAAFAGASLVLLLLPGPAVMYILTRSASQGRLAGGWLGERLAAGTRS